MVLEPSLWSHRGRDFKKKVHWGHETQFSSTFGAKWSLPCPFFFKAFDQSLLLLCDLEPGAFNPESQ
jgi:hypothetical protein